MIGIGQSMDSKKEKSKSELIRIAKGIYHGDIFTDRHIRKTDGDLLIHIFLPLAFFSKKQLELLKSNPPGLIWEYETRRMSMCINGYPCFPSMNFLTTIEAQIVMQIVDKLKNAEKTLIQSLDD